MSGISEHLAAIEFYRTTGLHAEAHNEGWLFLNVHWKDLTAAWPADEMAKGRDEFEKRVREQCHSENAANRIAEWRAALTPSPAPSAASDGLAAPQPASSPVAAEGQKAVARLGPQALDLAMRGLIGVIGTAQAQATRILANEGDADDRGQDRRDLPSTLAVIRHAVESLATPTASMADAAEAVADAPPHEIERHRAEHAAPGDGDGLKQDPTSGMG